MSAARRIYFIHTEGTTVRLGRTTLDVARAACLEGWDPPEPEAGTYWIDADVLDARGAVVVARRNVPIHPTEPACSERAHAWQDDGMPGFGDVVRGNGGGVILRHRCAHCGLARITDTWAQRPDNGRQGLTSIRYERPQ